MKSKKTLLGVMVAGLLFSTAFSARADERKASSADPTKSLPLVFDPATKKYFIGGNSKFLLKAGEDSSLIDRIEIAVDGNDYLPYGQAVEFKEEGKHTLKFRAVNPVNNWSPVQFVEVFVDLTPATTEAKFTEDRYFKSDAGVYLGIGSNLSLAAQDNLSGVAAIEYSWDGSNFMTYSRPLVVEKSGPRTLYYRSIDRVGNVEATKHLDYIVDATPPVSELQFKGASKPTVINGKTYFSDSVAFSVVANDDLSGVKQTWVVLDGKPQLYIKPIYMLQEGAHTLGYYSIDNVGNKEPMKTLSFHTVSTPPRTMAMAIGKSVNTGGINYATHDFQLKLEAKDNAVGLERIELAIDGEKNYRPYIEPIRFSTMGMHSVSYRALDRAGNVEPAKTYMVNIVDTVPETSLSTAQPLLSREGVTYSPAPNVITLNVSNSSGVGIHDTLVSINDGPFHSYTGPITVSAENRVYKIAYKSIDKLGNEEQVKSASFHVIRSTPIVDLFVTNGQSAEEQVRTNYLDQGQGGGERGVASEKSSRH